MPKALFHQALFNQSLLKKRMPAQPMPAIGAGARWRTRPPGKGHRPSGLPPLFALTPAEVALIENVTR
jgi:hypothetical protein